MGNTINPVRSTVPQRNPLPNFTAVFPQNVSTPSQTIEPGSELSLSSPQIGRDFDRDRLPLPVIPQVSPFLRFFNPQTPSLFELNPQPIIGRNNQRDRTLEIPTLLVAKSCDLVTDAFGTQILSSTTPTTISNSCQSFLDHSQYDPLSGNPDIAEDVVLTSNNRNAFLNSFNVF